MELSKKELLTLQILDDLHSMWTPHKGQITAGRPIVNRRADITFCQNGRKWGKTEFAAYMLWRHALLNPGSACYYVTPEYSHGREIIWNNQRLQRFGPAKYVKKISNQEARVVFNNGSFIKIIGSENWAVANGLTPDFVVYDEFKIFHPQWHTEFNPNRIVRKAPLVIIGTPPKPEDRNREQYEELAEEAKSRNDQVWMKQTSYDNPHIDPEWLDMEREKLFARGEEDVWFREYEGKIVPGGKSAIFPMFNEARHIAPHNAIIREIRKDLKKLEWFLVTDPGTTTCFAALFCAINPYTKKLYILDELYETNQQETSVRRMYPRMDAKMMEFYPLSDIDEDWFKGYDEAAAWFAQEVLGQYGVTFMPTQKHLHKKEEGLSLIKDQMLHDLVVISDRCGKLKWEIEGYAKDIKGNIPKKNDHLIDCFRYLNSFANYSMTDALEIIKQNNDEMRRGFTMKDDLDGLSAQNEWGNFNTFWK
jgi:hypothetical protein